MPRGRRGPWHCQNCATQNWPDLKWCRHCSAPASMHQGRKQRERQRSMQPDVGGHSWTASTVNA
eukprot:3606909-Alexandrium_andersonii.AAC.1